MLQRLWILVALALGLGGIAHAEFVGWPQVKTCTAGTHLWWYERDARRLLTAHGASCLPGQCWSEATLVAKAREVSSAASPAAAASAAVAASTAFTCDDTIRLEDTPRGALCRERSAFIEAHWKDVGATWRWKKLADEHGAFTLASANTVRYGVDVRWVQGQFQPGGYTCDSAAFGLDPAQGTVKRCDVVEVIDAAEPTCSVAPPPPPPPAPTVTHRVKPLTGATDRPVFAVVAGVRSTSALVVAGKAVRAAVGLDCDLGALSFKSGTAGDAYAPFAPGFDPQRVTLCSPVKAP